jgi:hypothetical protein
MDRHGLQSLSQSRARLAANLNALIEQGITSPSRLVEAGAITPSTLARIRAGTHAAYIDHLDRLAFALAVEPWQLLHPDAIVADMSPERVHAWERLIPILLVLEPAQLTRAVALCEKALQPLLDEAEQLKREAARALDQPPQPGGARNTAQRIAPVAAPASHHKRAKR